MLLAMLFHLASSSKMKIDWIFYFRSCEVANAPWWSLLWAVTLSISRMMCTRWSRYYYFCLALGVGDHRVWGDHFASSSPFT